jgi:3-oxoacyl-[acyl-carrier protein] reductase
MNLGIEGKVALVTGGSHGIGLAIAHVLAGEGAQVAVCARTADRVAGAAKELSAYGGKTLGLVGDALVPEDIERVMRGVTETWGTIHILVNNVGGGGRWGTAIVEDTPDPVWLEVYGKNALAAVRYTRLAIPFMRKQRWGRVVSITSILGREGGGRPWFTMAKSAEMSLMKTLALTPYLVRDGITFNTVAPGSIMIPNTGWEAESLKNPEEFRQKVDRDFPMGRLGRPEEVAQVVAFVCSDRAALVNGATIAVDGGESRSF